MSTNLFNQLFKETKAFYKRLNKIRCVWVDNNYVIFGNSGFTHLLIKNRKSRPINEKCRKLNLVKYISQIINNRNAKSEVRIFKNKKYGQIEYKSITAEINSRKIKVIIRKIGNGNYHFWSIMDT